MIRAFGQARQRTMPPGAAFSTSDHDATVAARFQKGAQIRQKRYNVISTAMQSPRAARKMLQRYPSSMTPSASPRRRPSRWTSGSRYRTDGTKQNAQSSLATSKDIHIMVQPSHSFSGSSATTGRDRSSITIFERVMVGRLRHLRMATSLAAKWDHGPQSANGSPPITCSSHGPRQRPQRAPRPDAGRISQPPERSRISFAKSHVSPMLLWPCRTMPSPRR